MRRTLRKALETARRLVETCDALIEIAAEVPGGASDVRTRWAIEMGFIRIGEEVSRLPEDVREAYPAQPWRVIIGMRNMAAHQYDDLSSPRVRASIEKDVPALRDYVRDVMIPGLLQDLAREEPAGSA